MRWTKSLNGDNSGPVIVDSPVYDASSIVRGEALTYGATTRGGLLITSGSLGGDFIGIALETIAASTTVLTTGTIVYAKVIMDPLAVYEAECDLAAANDVDVVSSTSTAATLGTCDDDLDGSWLYVNSGTGRGQLVFIGEATTTVMTLDTTTAFSTTPDSSTDVVIIRKPWRWAADGGRDLNAAGTLAANDEDETGQYLVLENYIETSSRPRAQLRPRLHHMLTNLHNDNVRFFTWLYPTDHILRGATTMA